MEEKNTTNQTNATKEVKHGKKSEKDSFADYKAEFKKIVWPSRPDIAKRTVTVIVTSLIVGAIIFGMDTILSFGYSAIIGFLG